MIEVKTSSFGSESRDSFGSVDVLKGFSTNVALASSLMSKTTSSSADTEMEDCGMFYDVLYGQDEPMIEESSSFVLDVAIQELEREIDRLPMNEDKEAYFAALEQEIKQRTHYVRSSKLMLAFLRSENFDVSKAAMRMVQFFRYKLDLFGPEALPHRITQANLNDDDMKVLASGFIHFGGLDCGGRIVSFNQKSRLRLTGMLNEHYAKSITRATFYQVMFMIEENPESQNKGITGVHWGLDCTLPLKDHRILFNANIKMCSKALPLKLAAIHHCFNNTITQMCVSWGAMLVPKAIRDIVKIHNHSSSAACFAELSKYGINVDALPIDEATGNFIEDAHRRQLEQWKEIEIARGQILRRRQQPMQLKSQENQIITQLEQFDEENKLLTVINDQMETENDTSDLEPMHSLNANGEDQQHSNNENAWNDSASELWNNSNTDTWNNASADFSPDGFIWGKTESYMELDDNNPSIKQYYQYTATGSNSTVWKNKDTEITIEKMSKSAVETTNDSFTRTAPTKRKANGCGFGEGYKGNDNIEVAIDAEEHLPLKLMAILRENSHPTAIWWSRGGAAFAMEKRKFPEDVLKNEFNGIKMDSFCRRLRRWGFRRLPRKSHEYVEYQHQLFQESCPHLVKDWDKEPKKDKFPTRLMKLLCSSTSSDEAIWWINSGTAFAVEKSKFNSEVLKHGHQFQGVKFTSFKRSLMRWGFKQLHPVGTAMDALVFEHPSFKRDAPELLCNWPGPKNNM